MLAIDALAELRRRGVDSSLVVAGDGEQREALVEHARAAGVTEAVRFLGRVSDGRKWQLYDSADVLLFGSTLEGFGLVVAEAQSRGLPVVAAEGTATAEALDPGRSGLLVPPSARAFAGAVSELAADSRRRAMAAHAIDFARRFDWDACAAGVAGVYRSLV
jgi:glycosyltransferase involved in cell wall biosynthesis